MNLEETARTPGGVFHYEWCDLSLNLFDAMGKPHEVVKF